jgi:hypothetical protein
MPCSPTSACTGGVTCANPHPSSAHFSASSLAEWLAPRQIGTLPSSPSPSAPFHHQRVKRQRCLVSVTQHVTTSIWSLSVTTPHDSMTFPNPTLEIQDAVREPSSTPLSLPLNFCFHVDTNPFSLRIKNSHALSRARSRMIPNPPLSYIRISPFDAVIMDPNKPSSDKGLCRVPRLHQCIRFPHATDKSTE